MKRSYRIIQGRSKAKPLCPRCDTMLDAWTGISGAKPTPGDVTLCMYCGSTLIFTDRLGVRLATEAEQDRVRGMHEFSLMQAMVMRIAFERDK